MLPISDVQVPDDHPRPAGMAAGGGGLAMPPHFAQVPVIQDLGDVPGWPHHEPSDEEYAVEWQLMESDSA